MKIGRYEKLPVQISAVELTTKNIADVIHHWVGMQRSWIVDEGIMIKTLEGNHLGKFGDFIVRGVNGEFYPVKPDIFWKTYREVE